MKSVEPQRIVFKIITTDQSAALSAYYKTLTWQQRLAIANYLNSVVYNYPEHNPPRLDRTVFKTGSMDLELG